MGYQAKDPLDPKLFTEQPEEEKKVYNTADEQADDLIIQNDTDDVKLSDEEINELNGHSQRTDIVFPELDKLGILEKAMDIAKRFKNNDTVRKWIRVKLKYFNEMNNETVDALRNANYRLKRGHKVPNSKKEIK